MEWKPYPNNRLFQRHTDGLVVIKSAEQPTVVNFFCGTCDHVLRTREDESSWREFGCCDHCAKAWAFPNRQKWKEGWRPTAEQVKGAESTRLPLCATLGLE